MRRTITTLQDLNDRQNNELLRANQESAQRAHQEQLLANNREVERMFVGDDTNVLTTLIDNTVPVQTVPPVPVPSAPVPVPSVNPVPSSVTNPTASSINATSQTNTINNNNYVPAPNENGDAFRTLNEVHARRRVFNTLDHVQRQRESFNSNGRNSAPEETLQERIDATNNLAENIGRAQEQRNDILHEQQTILENVGANLFAIQNHLMQVANAHPSLVFGILTSFTLGSGVFMLRRHGLTPLFNAVRFLFRGSVPAPTPPSLIDSALREAGDILRHPENTENFIVIGGTAAVALRAYILSCIRQAIVMGRRFF